MVTQGLKGYAGLKAAAFLMVFVEGGASII